MEEHGDEVDGADCDDADRIVKHHPARGAKYDGQPTRDSTARSTRTHEILSTETPEGADAVRARRIFGTAAEDAAARERTIKNISRDD